MITKEQATVFKQQVDAFIEAVLSILQEEVVTRMPEKKYEGWRSFTYSSHTGRSSGAYALEDAQQHNELVCVFTCRTPDYVIDNDVINRSVIWRSAVLLEPSFSPDEIEYQAATIAINLVDTYVQQIRFLAAQQNRIEYLILTRKETQQ